MKHQLFTASLLVVLSASASRLSAVAPDVPQTVLRLPPPARHNASFTAVGTAANASPVPAWTRQLGCPGKGISTYSARPATPSPFHVVSITINNTSWSFPSFPYLRREGTDAKRPRPAVKGKGELLIR